MKAFIENTKDGYVVMWTENYVTRPLRCFGDYYSAAMEFRNYLNNEGWERKERQIEGWAKTYDPTAKYSYPEFSIRAGIILRKQKHQSL